MYRDYKEDAWAIPGQISWPGRKSGGEKWNMSIWEQRESHSGSQPSQCSKLSNDSIPCVESY